MSVITLEQRVLRTQSEPVCYTQQHFHLIALKNQSLSNSCVSPLLSELRCICFSSAFVFQTVKWRQTERERQNNGVTVEALMRKLLDLTA